MLNGDLQRLGELAINRYKEILFEVLERKKR